jgi:uncharacterized protein
VFGCNLVSPCLECKNHTNGELMSRRKFALSWGRKIIFGLSWPLSMIVGAIYLRSFILPETFADGFYFLVTYIGHYGLINTLAYFLIFSPIILLFPTYYISRIWALVIVIGLNAFIFVDALSYSSYHLHFYNGIAPFLVGYGIKDLLGPEAGVTLSIVGLLVVSLLIWFRGEMAWRHMQGRFSNPVKNWYLILIFLCIALGKLVYKYNDVNPAVAELFPLNFNPPRSEKQYKEMKNFYYPTASANCQSKQNPNILIIRIKEWKNEDLTQESMPRTYHLKQHALSYNSHLAISKDLKSSEFSLFYSMPSSYHNSSKGSESSFSKELDSRKYEIIKMEDFNESSLVDLNKRFDQWKTDGKKPYFGSLLISASPVQADKIIYHTLLDLARKDVLPNTQVIITGAYAGENSDYTPLIWMGLDRRAKQINYLTSHYDLIPTLMEKSWNCKKAFKVSSLGVHLDNNQRNWVLINSNDYFKIVDGRNRSSITVKDKDVKNSGNNIRYGLIFSALKIMTKYHRPD